MRLSEMFDKAGEGDRSHLDSFTRRLMDGELPTSEEIASGYDAFLYSHVVVPSVTVLVQQEFKQRLEDEAADLPPVMKAIGAKDMMQRQIRQRLEQ